jgi:hypothetical protein
MLNHALVALEGVRLTDWISMAIAVAAVWAALVAQKTFRASRQVFVGVTEHVITAQAGLLRFDFHFSALGANVPARQVDSDYKLFLDDVECSVGKLPSGTRMLFPGVPQAMTCQLVGDDANAILSGQKILEVLITISYVDFYGKRHEYSTRYRFAHVVRNLLILGETLT